MIVHLSDENVRDIDNQSAHPVVSRMSRVTATTEHVNNHHDSDHDDGNDDAYDNNHDKDHHRSESLADQQHMPLLLPNRAGVTGGHDSQQATRLSVEAYCRRFRYLRALQCLVLFSYETLTEQALQLVNCIKVGECGNVLAEFPDVPCPANRNQLPLMTVAVLLLLYAVVFPAGLFIFLRKLNLHLHDHHHQQHDVNNHFNNNININNNHIAASANSDVELLEGNYGVFFDHYKAKFWWWEIQVGACMCLLVFEF